MKIKIKIRNLKKNENKKHRRHVSVAQKWAYRWVDANTLHLKTQVFFFFIPNFSFKKPLSQTR